MHAVISRLRCRGPKLAAALTVSGMLAVGGCAQQGGDTGLGINVVSDDQVEQMGTEAWQTIRQETPASENAQYQRTAEQISSKVLTAAGENPSQWEVVVFQGQEVNAFALPGGRIGVYEGMFATAQNDDQLAAVIAHEVAHVQQHHATERANTQAGTQLGAQLIGAALGASGGSEQTAQLLGSVADIGVVRPYSRNQELEADRRGLHFMAQAGYDPRQSIELWQRMAQSGGRGPAFLSTHPAPEDRIRQLQAEMPQAMQTYRAATG